MSARAPQPTGSTARPGRRPRGLLMVAGLGHRGLGIAADALAAGFPVVCAGPSPPRVRQLITELADDDELASALRAGLRTGALVVASGPPRGAVVDIAVFAPGGDPDGVAGPGSIELAAVGLAPALGPDAHVVLVGRGGLLAHADVVVGTIGLLTGRAAGPHYSLGFAVTSGCGAVPVVVSGVDRVSVRRTEALFGVLGHPTTTVTPPAAAEFVAQLQWAVLGPDPSPATDPR